jgi:hypothetical protein
MLGKTRYHNLSHIGVKYVRDQLIILSHAHINWSPYESVHHLLPTLVDDYVESYICQLLLIYFSIIE